MRHICTQHRGLLSTPPSRHANAGSTGRRPQAKRDARDLTVPCVVHSGTGRRFRCHLAFRHDPDQQMPQTSEFHARHCALKVPARPAKTRGPSDACPEPLDSTLNSLKHLCASTTSGHLHTLNRQQALFLLDELGQRSMQPSAAWAVIR